MVNPMAQPDPTKVVGRRVVAAILDALLVAIPAILLITASFEYTDVADLPTSPEQYCQTYEDQTDGICYNAEDLDDRVYYSDDNNLAGPGFYWISSFLLLVVLQGLTGWSPGKLILGLRVIREDGSKPGILKTLARWLLWIVDLFPYIIPGLTGFVVAISTPGHRRIGDYGARTFVVKRAAAGTPITIGDSGQIIVGEAAASAAVPAWAPPPTAPGAPTGWGPAVDPSSAGPAPSAPAVPAAPSPSTEGPQWDEARGTYIQWDPAQGKWMQWDEGFKAWTAIPGQ
jgi:uncharacterized RDD family membrane protein YckC